MPLANLSLKDLDIENKHWLKEKVKVDTKAIVVDLKSDQKFHLRKGEPYSEEEEHKIIEWILVRERLQPRNWSVGGKTYCLQYAYNLSLLLYSFVPFQIISNPPNHQETQFGESWKIRVPCQAGLGKALRRGFEE